MSISKRFQARNGLDNNLLTLINVATPVNGTDAANKTYADLMLPKTGGTMTGPITFTPQTPPTYAQGALWYDTNEMSLTYFNDVTNNSLHIGKELQQRVRNQTGATITKGKIVYISGATGQTPLIALAQANAYATSQVLGIVNADIANNAYGYVTTVGVITQIDTSAFTDGQLVYLSPTTAGAMTATEPSSPSYAVHLGVVTYSHATNGRMYFSPVVKSVDDGYFIGQLSTAHGGTGLTSYTANTLIYASSTSALASTPNLVCTGSRLGIGSTNFPVCALDVYNSTAVASAPSARFAVNAGGGTVQAYSGLSIYYNLSNGFAESTIVYGNTTNSYLAIGRHNGTTYSEMMRLTNGGNLLLGTTSSSSFKIDVAGTARTGSLTINQQLSQPTAPTGVGSTTGGTITAGTYYALVEAIDANGFSTGYTTVSTGVTTTGSTSSIVWSWTAVPNAASYLIKIDTSSTGPFPYGASVATNTYTQTVVPSSLTNYIFSPTTTNNTGSIYSIGQITSASIVQGLGLQAAGTSSTPNVSIAASNFYNGSGYSGLIFNHYNTIAAAAIYSFNQFHSTNPKELRITNTVSGGNITFFTKTTSGQAKIAQIDSSTNSFTIFRQDGTSEGGQLNLAKSLDNTTAFYLDVYGTTAEPSLRVVSTKSGVGSVFEINSDGNVVATCTTLSLTNATRGTINFGSNGIAIPSTTQNSPSAGTKLVLFNTNSTSTDVDYALGISFVTMWYSVPTNGNHTFYVSNTAYAAVNSSGIRAYNGGAIGYGSGSGGAATQQTTSRTTAITANFVSGTFQLFSAVGSATWSSFTVNNSKVAVTDTIILSVQTGTNSTYQMFVTHVAAGSFRVNFACVGTIGAADAPIVNFTVLKNSTV